MLKYSPRHNWREKGFISANGFRGISSVTVGKTWQAGKAGDGGAGSWLAALFRKQNVNSSGAGLQNLKAYPYCPSSSATLLPKDFTAFPTAPPAEGHVLKTLTLTRLTGVHLIETTSGRYVDIMSNLPVHSTRLGPQSWFLPVHLNTESLPSAGCYGTL